MDNKETVKHIIKNTTTKSPPRKSTSTKIEQINRFLVQTTEIEYETGYNVNQQLNHVFGL